MVRKRLKAVLALLVATMFLLQAAPMYSFADEAETSPTAEQTQETENTDSEVLNFAIDDEGNKVDLPEDYSDADGDTVATAEPASGGFYEADTDAFFEYDENEVTLAAEEVAYETDFSGASVGSTSVDGWVFATKSKDGNEKTSTFEVVDSERGSVLRMEKKKNGAKTEGGKAAGDETVLAMHDLPNPAHGHIAFTADIKVEAAGRFGVFLYGQSEDLAAATESATVPYLGRAYFWDTGAKDKDPATTEPNGLSTWSDTSRSLDENVGYSVGQWYTMRFDLDTEAGTYSFVLYDADGNEVVSKPNLQLDAANLAASEGAVQGVGVVISDDSKSLGTVLVDNIKFIDNNSAANDAANVAADAAALSLPVGVDAGNITEGFTLPLKGQLGSDITWSSSNESVVSVNNSTGEVTVNRPAYTGVLSVDVTLTATLKKNDASATRSLSLKVTELAPATSQERAEGDAALVTLPDNLNVSNITEGFTMPVTGTYGSTITYTASNPAVTIDNATGKVTVTNPAFTGAGVQNITITATVKNGSATITKEFTVQVKELEPTTDQEKAQYAANNALIGGIDPANVRQESFYLGDSGDYGSKLSWTSSNSEYIEIKNNYDEYVTGGGEDGSEAESETTTQRDGFTAVVTRPARDDSPATVILTVTATVGGATASKDFELTVIPEDAIKAYPGVEGYGAYSAGGRGGKVYHVTTLAHDGEGSLKYGLEQVQGARTIVFDVGGVIDLTPLGGPITIKGEKYSNVTIAGQTAPYPGITLKGYGLTVSSAHDVIIRNIKIRIGDVLPDGEVYQSDPMSIGNSRRVIVDHCSMEWAIDMDFRATGEYITISNTIFAKSLLHNSPHEKGGHAYVGMINEGARKVTFSKNFVGDSTQRSPRITDADWVDSYNCILYNCGNGYDLFNYEWQDKNAKMNVYNNYARKGPSLSNATPYRAGRGREYSGGIMAYFEGNYGKGSSNGLQEKATNNGAIATELEFGSENKNPGNPDRDLSNVTLDEWNNNPASYDNNGKSSPAATFTYMTYPFPAPRGDVMEVYENGNTSSNNNIVSYALDDNGMGATRPARDLYDTMLLTEMKGGTDSSATLSAEEVSPFFDELEKRTGRDYSEFKVERKWTVKQGAGPVLKGAGTDAADTKPVDWDNYTDVNKNNPNYNATEKYGSNAMNFEIGDWWGEYCGAPGQEITYTLYDSVLDRTVKTTDPNYDQTRYTLVSEDQEYVATERTVSDLVPSDWVYEDFPEIADFMNQYREENYPGMTNPDDPRYNPSYKIAWDGMGDGIPNWYKEYRGWSTNKHLASVVNADTGYTYLEEYLQFMADDQPLAVDDTPASIENFKVNNLGYSTAQVFWNTDYRTACVLEYGTEPGVYTNKEILAYDETTDYYHTYHAQTLVDLEPDTQYYYKVTAIDENSNVTVAEYDPNDDNEKNMTFKTTINPSTGVVLPSKPTVTNQVPYLNQVRLNWTGDVATDEGYEIYYDTVNHGSDYSAYAYKLTGIEARTNKQVVTGLTNDVTYYFLVVAVNANGRTPSDVVSAIPTGVLFDYDFTKMTDEEKSAYLKDQYMYVLGGKVDMTPDPDTGENVLQLLDETNSHGVNMDNKLAVTQDETFTYEVKMKLLYQKQTDALNHQKNVEKVALNEHNTLQLNFYKDVLPSEDMDSTNSALWETVFTIYFDSESTPISETSSGRFDGTVEHNTLKFGSTSVGSYKTGITPGSDSDAAKVLPPSLGYSLGTYKNTTVYGDAKYSNQADTDKTLHGIWYYQLGSAEFVTYKVVVNPAQNNVKVYADGQPIYEAGEFSEDVEEPYNVGKIQIKSRNDGYSWVNVASIRAYTGDGTSSSQTPPAPVGPGTIGATGGGGSGSGGMNTATATPAPTADPNATATPTAEPTATMNPDTNKYFDDLADVQWAVEPINALAEAGIINGVAERTFAPADNVTRAEYITMLMRAFGEDTTPAENVPFADVQAGEWYYEPIAKAVALGVTNGYTVNDETYFGVDDNISREDMMVMAYRAMTTFGIDIPSNKGYETFADQSDISDYAVEAIEKMYCAEIVNGVGSNMLDPKGSAERAQSAKIIYGLLEMEGTVNE